MTQIRESRHTASTSHNTNGGDIEVMKTDTRFATKLDSVDDVPEPMRGTLVEKLPSHEPIRLLIHAPNISTNEEESPITATLLAVTGEGWLVVSESEEGNVSVEDCKFDDILFLELTSLILWGELKIHFAAVGTSYCAGMRFSTVTEGLYREAIDLLLDRIDQARTQAAPTDDEDTTAIFENWPIEFRTAALRYRPKLQRILAATRWPSVVDGLRRMLCPAGALLMTERELVLISQQKTSHRLHAAGVGNIIYFPLARLWDFHVSQQQRLGVLALEAHAKRGKERLEILFPADHAKPLSKAMENAFATTEYGV
jgi:hypothetical protein